MTIMSFKPTGVQFSEVTGEAPVQPIVNIPFLNGLSFDEAQMVLANKLRDYHYERNHIARHENMYNEQKLLKLYETYKEFCKEPANTVRGEKMQILVALRAGLWIGKKEGAIISDSLMKLAVKYRWTEITKIKEQQMDESMSRAIAAMTELLTGMASGSVIQFEGDTLPYGMGPIGNVGHVIEGQVVGDMTVSQLMIMSNNYLMAQPATGFGDFVPELPVEPKPEKKKRHAR